MPVNQIINLKINNLMLKILPAPGKLILLFSALLAFLPACRRDDPSAGNLTAYYNSEVALKWSELLLEIDRYSPGFLPPVSARAFAYIGLAAYETAVPGMPEY